MAIVIVNGNSNSSGFLDPVPAGWGWLSIPFDFMESVDKLVDIEICHQFLHSSFTSPQAQTVISKGR